MYAVYCTSIECVGGSIKNNNNSKPKKKSSIAISQFGPVIMIFEQQSHKDIWESMENRKFSCVQLLFVEIDMLHSLQTNKKQLQRTPSTFFFRLDFSLDSFFFLSKLLKDQSLHFDRQAVVIGITARNKYHFFFTRFDSIHLILLCCIFMLMPLLVLLLYHIFNSCNSKSLQTSFNFIVEEFFFLVFLTVFFHVSKLYCMQQK